MVTPLGFAGQFRIQVFSWFSQICLSCSLAVKGLKRTKMAETKDQAECFRTAFGQSWLGYPSWLSQHPPPKLSPPTDYLPSPHIFFSSWAIYPTVNQLPNVIVLLKNYQPVPLSNLSNLSGKFVFIRVYNPFCITPVITPVFPAHILVHLIYS